MLNLKKFSKRTLRRDRNDDLSMLTGGRPSISLGGSRSIAKNRNRPENILGPPRQQSSGVTLNSIPSLVKTTDSRQAVFGGKPRGILKPPVSNHLYSATPQTHYWSTYANTGGISKPRISSTVYNMSTSRGQNKPTSTWKVHSTAPITREDASLLQREMISTMSGGESSYGSASRYFSATPVPAQGLHNQFSRFSFSTPRQAHVIPSLVRSVQPPVPSPIFPVAGALPTAWDTPSQAGPANGCGVHQSEWMDRTKCMNKAPTKQYSMEQIIDILCGFATPDSIMADQLFKPLPTPTQPKVTPLKSAENRLNVTASKISNENLNDPWNVSSHQNKKQKSNPVNGNENDDDDEETSVYFRNEKSVNDTSVNVKKKQVSFLTDSDGKLCVNEFIFNRFSQELLSSGSSRNSTQKENMDPNFESILPPPITANPNDIFSNQQSSTKVNSNFLPQREEQPFNPIPQDQCEETTSPYFNNILPTQPAPLVSHQPDINQRFNNESSSAYQSNLSSQPKNQSFNPFEDHHSSGSRSQKDTVESNLESILALPSPALREAETFMNDFSSLFNPNQLPELQGQLFTQDFLNSCSSNMNSTEDKRMNPVDHASSRTDETNLFSSSEMTVNSSFNVSETLQQLLNSETFLF